MLRLLRPLLLISICGLASFTLSAQTTAVADDDDLQSWNDVILTVPVDKKVDLYFPVTLRLSKNVTRVDNARIGAGIIYKVTKSFSVTPFYTFIRYRNSANKFLTENRLTMRGVYKFPTKQFGLSHRSQFEYRFRPTGNLWRYRPSITLEKELPKKFVSGLKLFVTEEPFFESASGRFSKNRFSLGFNKVLNKKISVDIFYLRQDDNFSHPGTINVIGTAWKIKL